MREGREDEGKGGRIRGSEGGREDGGRKDERKRDGWMGKREIYNFLDPMTCIPNLM